MKKITRLTAILVLALTVLQCFTGCCDPEPESAVVHSSVLELEDILARNSAEAGTTKANLYYDNTQSMYGYICEGTGRSSEFTIVCQNILDVIKNYREFSLNALAPNAQKLLKWENTDASVFSSSFKKKDFYTFQGTSHYGSFDRANNQYGPLQSLFASDSSSVNFDELNVFITDLAEQELNNKLLAEEINDIVFDKEDHSVALYCIESYFKGYAAVPASGITDGGAVEMLNNDAYEGTRPFYCLIVGPSIEVISLCNTLDSVFSSSGMTEGKNYNSIKVMAKRGIMYAPITGAEYVAFDDMYASPDDKGDNDYEAYPSVTIDNSNFNYNIKALSNYDEMFPNIDRKLPGLCYVYNPEYSAMDNTNYGKASINFAIPLSNLADGTPAGEDVKYFLNPEDIKVYGYTSYDEVETDEYGDEVDEITKWVWEEISFFDLFESSSPYITEATQEFCANGSKIDRVSDYATNADLKEEEYPKENLELYSVQGESGALKMRFSFDNMDNLSEKYTYITIVGKVTALRDLEVNTPAWINKYDLPDTAVPNFGNPNSTPEFFQKTAGLDEFYTYLVGRMSSAEQKKEFDSHMTKTVTDVVINVCLDEDALI